MSPQRIAVIQGHPDASRSHWLHALVDAYMQGAAAAGHETRVIDVARIEFPLLRSKEEFDHGAPPPAIIEAQAAIQ